MKKGLTEKECKACGALFMPTNSLQLYCEACRSSSHPEKIAKRYDMASARNASTYYDNDIELKQTACKQCGKTFTYIIHRRYESYTIPDFCSTKCRSTNRIQNTICNHCGKPMLETDDIHNTHGHEWYCCEECREAEKWETARKEGKVKICPVCGKEFIKNTTFCSKQCYLADCNDKKENPPAYTLSCCICGQTVTSHKKPKNESLYKCPACAEKRRESLILEREKHERKMLSRKKDEEIAQMQKDGLCTICMTPYKNCERMQTGFRVKPKGAIYKDSKIVKCPKFNTNKLKYNDPKNFA